MEWANLINHIFIRFIVILNNLLILLFDLLIKTLLILDMVILDFMNYFLENDFSFDTSIKKTKFNYNKY